MELFPEIDLFHDYQAFPGRQFKIDFASRDAKVGIEIQGGIYVEGMGHRTSSGLKADYEKQQLAAEHGWLIIPLTVEQSTDIKKLEKVAGIIRSRLTQN